MEGPSTYVDRGTINNEVLFWFTVVQSQVVVGTLRTSTDKYVCTYTHCSY